MSDNEEELVVMSPKMKTICSNKGNTKMTKYHNKTSASEQSNSDITMRNESGTFELRTDSAKRAMKLANEKLHRSNCHKYPVGRFGYNKYMAHHYLYMVKVAEVCKIESYAEAS